MPIRPIQLPSDFAALSDIILASFLYPENETWSVQSDEKEQLVDMIKNLARLWPLIRGIRVAVPLSAGLAGREYLGAGWKTGRHNDPIPARFNRCVGGWHSRSDARSPPEGHCPPAG